MNAIHKIAARRFMAVATALIASVILTNPTQAGSCPAFTVAMIDAAALASDLEAAPTTIGPVFDDPSTGNISCQFNTFEGSFVVEVNNEVAALRGHHQSIGDDDTLLRIIVGGLTIPQKHACRAQILQSFVWNQICAPELQ